MSLSFSSCSLSAPQSLFRLSLLAAQGRGCATPVLPPLRIPGFRRFFVSTVGLLSSCPFGSLSVSSSRARAPRARRARSWWLFTVPPSVPRTARACAPVALARRACLWRARATMLRVSLSMSARPAGIQPLVFPLEAAACSRSPQVVDVGSTRILLVFRS